MDWGQCFIHHRLSMPIKQVSLKSSLHKRYYLGNQRDMQQEATPKILPSAPKGYRMFFSETNKKDIFQTLPHDPNINKPGLYTLFPISTPFL